MPVHLLLTLHAPNAILLSVWLERKGSYKTSISMIYTYIRTDIPNHISIGSTKPLATSAKYHGRSDCTSKLPFTVNASAYYVRQSDVKT